MAVRYRCKSCGYVLLEFTRAGQDYTGIPTPEDIIRLTGGICPRCKKLISVPSPAEIWNSISIRVAETRIPVAKRVPWGEVAEA